VLTRTIWVSCLPRSRDRLSHFLLRFRKRQPSKNCKYFMGPNSFFLFDLFTTITCSAGHINFVQHLKPGHAHLTAINTLHRDRFLASRQLVPRDARLQLGQGLRRDSFLPKEPAPSTRGAQCLPPTLRSGQDWVRQPPHITGPL
jgi:hypothetical protein